ncbi:MAG: NUDIX hydrolase [Chloroflexota bacterium]|nr:NUDIX hydrolase [Chloroflexota bacterium]
MTSEAELPEVLSSERVYEGHVFDIDHDAIRFPDGIEAMRATVRHPGAVALVVIDVDGRWLLVEQYRHPAGKRLIEIPAGTREPGEAPDVTAHRELREETGYDADSLVRIGGAWMAPGFTSEYIDFYLATGLRESPLSTGDEEDLSAPIPYTREAIEAAVAAGEIEDAKTLVALQLYALRERTQG